jgi:hypothetical protein
MLIDQFRLCRLEQLGHQRRWLGRWISSRLGRTH